MKKSEKVLVGLIITWILLVASTVVVSILDFGIAIIVIVVAQFIVIVLIMILAAIVSNKQKKYVIQTKTYNSPQSKRCINCGSTIALNSEFCNSCGVSQITEIECEYCGHINDSKLSICEKCNGFLK